MVRTQLILPCADSGCGKVFYGDRHTADGHRIALEFWNRATGHVREGYQLAVYRCKRCGGFHISQKRIERVRVRSNPHDLDREQNEDRAEPISRHLPSQRSDAPYPSESRGTASWQCCIASGSAEPCLRPNALPDGDGIG